MDSLIIVLGPAIIVFLVVLFFYLFLRESDVFHVYTKQEAALMTNPSINLDERSQTPFVCSECGMGMKREDYSCPRCLSRKKVRRGS